MEVDPLYRVILGTATLVLLIAGLLLIGQELTGLPPGSDYIVYFKDSVAGLSKNSKVTYEGREVGKVKNIQEEVHPDGIYSRVTLTLDTTIYEQKLIVEEVLGSPAGQDWFRARVQIVKVDGLAIETSIHFFESLNRAMRRIKTREELISRFGEGSTAKPTSFPVEILRAEETMEILINSETGHPRMRFAQEGTRAHLYSNFVTGIKTIELVGGGKDLTPLKANKTIPYEKTGLTSMFDEISKDVPRIVQNISSMSRQLDLFSQTLNNQNSNFSKVLANVERMTASEGEIPKTLEGFTQTAQNASEAFDKLRGLFEPEGEATQALNLLSAQLSAKEGAEGDLILSVRQARDTLLEIQKSLGPEGSANLALEEIRLSFAQLKIALEEDGQIATRLDEMGYVLRHDLRRSLAQMSASMQALQETLQKMSANPNSLFFGEKSGK